jgi:hypothetical protein
MSADAPPNPLPQVRRRGWRGWRMALLGLIGALALVLPLSQVLRFQVEALIEDRSERARLDPLAEAVAVQRGLIGHDEVATRVLRGRTALEGERRLRQAEVDHHLFTLQASLQAGAWQPAWREAQALQADWRLLAGHVAGRRIDAEASRRGHRLLQEQAVQVMDLVQALLSVPVGRADTADAAHSTDWQARIDARRRELDGRIARAESTLALLGLAALVLLAGAGLLLGTQWRSAAAARALQSAADGSRRGVGRRFGDRPARATPAELTAASLDSVSRAVEDERS